MAFTATLGFGPDGAGAVVLDGMHAKARVTYPRRSRITTSTDAISAPAGAFGNRLISS